VGGARSVPADLVPQLAQEQHELVVAAMNVADDVERSVIITPIGPRPLSLDLDGLDLFRCPEDEHTPKALAAEPLQGALELGTLSSHDVRPEVPIGPRGVAIQAEPLRHVEDDGDREHVVGASEPDERSTSLALYVRSVDDREPAGGEPLARDEVQGIEGVLRRRLVVLVVGNETPERVRGEHLGREEMPGGERGLSGARRTDEHHQREHGDRHRQRLKTPICVGDPTSSSSGPTAT
jgi:hypothetical protein